MGGVPVAAGAAPANQAAANNVAVAQSVSCTIVGTSGDDGLVGTAGDDVICGLGGDDTLEGLGGNDVLIGGPGSDVLAGNSGDDTLYGHAGEDRLFGGPGRDLVAGGGDADLVRGGDGDDELHGSDGADTLIGGDGNDELWGGSGADTMEGRGGDDKLLGGPGDDLLAGNAGDDWLLGQDGSDLLIGGPGSDQLGGGGDGDVVRGGDDDDYMQGEDGTDTLVGGAGNDLMWGGPGDDLMEGRAGNDKLYGDDGADLLAGNEGNDTLIGGDGDDQLFGGPDLDDCDGGPGNNTILSCGGPQWTQVGGDINGEAAGDLFGYSVAMSSDGNTVITGALGNGEDAGHARVYRLIGSTWIQVGGDIDGEAADDWFGFSVAMSSDGNTVIVGAPYNNGAGNSAGQARVYRFDGSTWAQVGGDIDGEAAEDDSGTSVAMSSDGNTVIVGAPFNDGAGNYAGHVRVYRFDGFTWTQVGADIDGEGADDVSGFTVAMSSDGNTVIIGVPYNDSTGIAAGQARVYRFDGSTWNRVGSVIDGEAPQDQSGLSVAMNGDGNTVIVGAPYNSGNGYESGHARVYRWDGSAWTKVGADIDGKAVNDFSGFSVAMSSDGNTVIIGGPSNDAGHARVYRLDGSA